MSVQKKYSNRDLWRLIDNTFRLMLLVLFLAAAAGVWGQTEPAQGAEAAALQESGETDAEETAVPQESGDAASQESADGQEAAGSLTWAETEAALKERLARGIPEEYAQPAEHPGEVERIDYESAGESRYAYVYVPYGYEESSRYDILYLMHGGGGSQETFFGGAGESNEFKNGLDHLIEEGQMEPLLIVTPTFYPPGVDKAHAEAAGDLVQAFPEELVQDLIPAVESAYATYAVSTDAEGLRASRDHRAFSGFSMGSVTTWHVFQQALGAFSVFLPVSGDSWAVEPMGGNSHPEETAQILDSAVKEQGYTGEDFRIYGVTGSEDSAEENMGPMIRSMAEMDGEFRMGDGGNLWFVVREGGEHSTVRAKEYLLCVLPVVYG